MSNESLMTIFAHQDDETFSAGGILSLYSQLNGAYAVSVTSDPNRREEFQRACKILGVTGIVLENDSVTSGNTNSIRKQVMEVIRKHQPGHIITHIANDYHHEHRLVRSIVEEAVEWVSHTTSNQQAVQVKSLWAAETTVLISFPEIYIDISEVNESRLHAIRAYESQFHKGGDGFYSEFHNTRTKLRGIQAGVDHAEAFVQVPIAQAGSFKPDKVLSKLPY